MNCGFVKAIFPRGRSRLSMSISNDIKSNYKSFYDQWHTKCPISCEIVGIKQKHMDQSCIFTFDSRQRPKIERYSAFGQLQKPKLSVESF